MNQIERSFEPTNEPLLSIVIVNSDGAEDTLHCLASIYKHPPTQTFEVIVVDNCSAICPLAIINQTYPQVKTFSAPRRQGFAHNYNLGISQARGQYVLILNNDTIVHPESLSALLAFILAHPEYGILGPQLNSANGQIQIECSRPLITWATYLLNVSVLSPGTPTGYLWEKIQQRRISQQQSGETSCINGACMLLTRDYLCRAGLLDENYQAYFEDVEWCHRAHKMGLKVGYVAEARITHYGDRSLEKVKAWAKQNEYYSALRYFRHYYSINKLQAFILWFTTMMVFFARGVVLAIAKIINNSLSNPYFALLKWIVTDKSWM